jgi:hypothetical protein
MAKNELKVDTTKAVESLSELQRAAMSARQAVEALIESLERLQELGLEMFPEVGDDQAE